MSNVINYDKVFSQALGVIKSVRDPHPERPEISDLGWNAVRENAIFSFGGAEYEKYSRVLTTAKSESICAIIHIIIQLAKAYELGFETIEVRTERKGMLKSVLFALLDRKNNCLLFFKDIEDCNYWKLKGRETPEVQDVLNMYGATSCKFIYLMYDKAYLQVIGHNNDETDPGRGYNVYSIKWFFETYFGAEEYLVFSESLKAYVDSINAYLGYIVIRTLTPTSLVNFVAITENRLRSFDYSIITTQPQKNFMISKYEFGKLRAQFFDKRAYGVLLSQKDYAESLITAEWLYDSMRKVQSVDLTMVGMGYFKALEQLLFELICVNKNQGYLIRKDRNQKDNKHENAKQEGDSSRTVLDDERIASNTIDTTIGSMAIFVRDYYEKIMRGDIVFKTKKYVREAVFAYKGLRNGYLHKDNIHSWETIEEIRAATYRLFFLLLGSFSLTDNALWDLGLSQYNERSDYERLCEYVNYHANDLFFIEYPDYGEDILFGCADPNTRVVDGRYIDYSGVYFRPLDRQAKTGYRFTEHDLPAAIYLGKFDIGGDEEVHLEPKRCKKVFENGKFVGPSIAEEDLEY